METIIERVDDIPLLLSEFGQGNLIGLFDEHFLPHGNWTGASIGTVTVGFLAYILSCSDHRLSHVETWSSERLHTLQYGLATPLLRSKDFTDDKLGDLLDKFSDDDAWHKFEHAHNQSLINIYNLKLGLEPIRLDAMITQSHRSVGGGFEFGYSKQHRADLPQLKTMVATLDPLSMPLHSLTVSGNQSDDILYLPVIEKVIEDLKSSEQLFVGDSKMGSLEIRSYLQGKAHYYLVPLSKKQCSTKQLSQYLSQQAQELIDLTDVNQKGETIVKAQAFEIAEQMEDTANEVSWIERRLVVYSPVYAKSQQKRFEDRITKAKSEIGVLLEAKQGKKRLKTRAEIQAKVDNILKKYQVVPFIDVNINEKIILQTVRKYKNKPASIRKKQHFTLTFTINETAKKTHLKQLGWRVYGTNAPIKQLSTIKAVECYYNEYKIEHKFNELLNKITVLMPVYLGKPNRIKALIRLLLLALKYVSLMEYQVRNQLKDKKQKLKKLYQGNPNRATNQPTTNMILRRFRNIHLTIIKIENNIKVKITGLKKIHFKIMELLNINSNSYLGMEKLFFSCVDFSET